MIFEDYNGLPSSLLRCYEILPEHEAADIAQAADLAHRGFDFDAERTRKFAGYNNLGFRADADGVSCR